MQTCPQPIPAPDLDFHCTLCGECCRGLWLPLALGEAMDWLHDGQPVAVLTQAIPWPADPPAEDVAAHYKKARSFAAMAGNLPVRVLASLAAPQGHHCPNLQTDQHCRIYERRPAVCRAYPAEPNPLLQLDTGSRRCPPESWQAGGTPLLRNGEYVDGSLRRLLRETAERGIHEAVPLRALCSRLGIRVAALANEGFAVNLRETGALRAALAAPCGEPGVLQAGDWEFITHRETSMEAIRRCGAQCRPATSADGRLLQYISLDAG